MSDKTYNGWSNYATWRINLEIFDDLDISEFHGIEDKVDPELICLHTLSEALQEMQSFTSLNAMVTDMMNADPQTSWKIMQEPS